MDTLGQLKLLLWKDFLVRRRHLRVATLVFGWAIGVFLILYSVRESIDPEYTPTCQYTARALPSTGLFPFVQSFICNVDNKCNNVSQYEEVPQYKNARLTRVAKQLQNAFTNETIVSVVKSLPDMIELLKSIGDGLDSPDLEGIFGPGIKISNLFDDSNLVKRRILENNPKLVVEFVDNIFNASVKLGHVFKSFGSTDLGSAICDPNQLEKYLILDDPQEIENVSSSLCNIDGSDVPSLMQNIFDHADFTGLLNKIGQVVDHFTNYDMFIDLRSLVEVILDLNFVKTNVPNYLKLKNWLPEVISEMKNLNHTHLDQKFIQKSLQIIEPHFIETTQWSNYKNLITNSMNLMMSVEDKIITKGLTRSKNMNLGPKNFSDFVSRLRNNIEKMQNPSENDLIEKQTEMFEIFNDTLNILPAFYLNTNKSWVYVTSVIDSVKDIVNNEIFNKFSDIFYIYSQIVLGLHNTIKGEYESEQIIYDLCQKHSNTVSTLFSLGPEFITSMLNCFANMTCTSIIVQHKNNISEIFCDKQKIENVLPEAVTIKNIGILCNIELNNFMHDLNNEFNLDWINASIAQEDKKNYTFTKAIENTENFVNYLTKRNLVVPEDNSDISWEVLLPDIENIEWKNIIDKAHKNAGLYMVNIQLCYFKESIKDHKNFNQILNVTASLMEGILTEYKLIPKQLISTVVNHLPDIVETIVKTFTNKTQIMTLTSIDDWEQYYCNTSLFGNDNHTILISKIICEKLSLINMQNNLPWFGHPVTSTIYDIVKNYNNLTDLNWDTLIMNAQNMYLVVFDIVNTPLVKYNWEEKEIFKSNFWINWVKNLDMETEIHFGIQLATKIADFIERNYLDTKTQENWKEIQTVTSTVNNFIIFALDIIEFSIVSENSTYKNLYPYTFKLSQIIIKSLDNLTTDLEKIIQDENTVIIDKLIIWFQKPCTNNILEILPDISLQSKNAFVAIQDAICNKEKYQNEWIVSQKETTFNQEKQWQMTASKLAKILYEIKKSNNNSTIKQLDLLHKGIKFETVILKIVEKNLETNYMRHESLNQLWSKLKTCQKNCEEITIDTARYTTKFIAAGVVEIKNRISEYLHLINETTGVDPLRLIGFSNTSGVYKAYLKFPDLIRIFIHSYRSPIFEQKIFEQRSQNLAVKCADIMNNLIIPDNNSVTRDDLKALAKYLCPSIFDWPILQDNLFLSTVSKLQDMFLDQPVSKFNVSFVTMVNDVFDLKTEILDMAQYGTVNVKELWNANWTKTMEDLLTDLKKLQFSSKNTITRYFKYIEKPEDKLNLTTNLINSKYGFGDFSYLLSKITNSLENIMSLNTTNTSNSTAQEEFQQLKNLIEIYTKEIASFFSYIYVRFDGQNFWKHFDEFCKTTEHMYNDDVFIPSWIISDDDQILDRLCNISNDKSLRNALVPINELSKIKNYNVNLEEIVVKFLSTLINFFNNDTTIDITSTLSKNFNLTKIFDRSFPTDEEIRNTSLRKAYQLSKYKYSDIRDLDESLIITTTLLKVLQGGDWWNTLLNNLQDPLIQLILRIIERTPQIILHLADAAISPHLLFDITNKITRQGPHVLCDPEFEISRYIHEENIISLVHQVCNLPRGKPQEESFKFESNETHSNYKLQEEIFARRISDFQISLKDLAKQGPKNFNLPKWMNKTDILQEYLEYSKSNSKPLKLLQTVITVLNEVIDVGSVFYKNESSSCWWCTWATILTREFSSHLSKSQKYTEFLCEAPKMNFTQIKETLINDFKWGEFYNDMRKNKSYYVDDFDREVRDIVEVVRVQLITFYTNKTLQSLPAKCFRNIVDTPALRNISTYISAVREITSTLKSSHVTFLNSPMFDLSSPLMSTLIQNNIPILKPVEEIINSTDTFANELSKVNVNNFAIIEILQSKIDVNLVSKLNTTQDLENYLSNRNLFNKLFTFENLTYTKSIYKELNSDNVSVISEIFFESLNKENLNDKIVNWRNESIKSLDWVTRIFENLEKVILNGGNILEFVSNIDFSAISSKSFNISNMLKGVLDLLQKNSIENLFQSLRELVKSASPLIQNEKLQNDLYQILDGIENMDIFKSLGLLRIKYKISDLVKDWKNVRQFLTQEMHLNEIAVDTILNASVDLSEILSSQGEGMNIRQMICDPTELTKVVDFQGENSQEIAEEVSEMICNMSLKDIQSLATVSLQNINLTKILETVMNSSVSSILTSAHMTEEEGRKVVKNIGVGADLLPYLKNLIANISEDMNLIPKFDEIKQDNGHKSAMVVSPDLLASASNLLCGRPLVQNSNKLYKVISEAKDFNADKYEIIEQKTLPTDFCRNVYKDVVNMDAGKIIWAYIKPLLRGQILYTPNVPAVRDILEKANTTFDSIAGLQEVLNKITEGLTALEDRERLEHVLDNIQDFMNSSLVKMAVESVIKSVTNKSISLQDVNFKDMLNNFGDSKSISPALKFGADMLKCVLLNRFIGIDSELELEEEAKRLMQTNEFIAGIVFTNINHRLLKRSTTDLPKDISYKIRMDIDSVPSTSYLKYKFWTPGPESDFLDELRYFRGFIQLQDLIDNAIISLKSVEELPKWDTLTQEMPYACWTRDFFKSALSISQTFQVCFFFGLIAVVAAAVRYVVWEKESGNTMVMNVMGLRYLTHCASWFIVTLFEMLFVMICIFIILKAGGILPMTDNLLLFLYLVDFGFAVIMFCYMISSIFDSASLAAVGSAIFYLLSFMPYIVIISLETSLEVWAKMLANLSMSTSFCYGCLYIIRFELQGVGLQWNNAWDTPIPGDSMNFGITCLFLLGDGILYGIIGYLWSKKSQELHKIFHFMPSWLFTNNYQVVSSNPTYVTFGNELFINTNFSGENYLDDTVSSSNIINDDPLKIGVTIKSLTKVYNSRKKTVKAIEDIDITLYTGQVTTLLGHNGAGKTTLIKILTGMMQPTSGQIIINNEITDQENQFRRFLGVCPQGSVLINTMSALEHLIFYAKLKTSRSTQEVMPEVMDMIDNLSLGKLSDEPVSHLSEGTRRRLCVAIAFIGKPKLVVLDEPSSGVDPVARRQIWDLVVRYKEGCTVLLTTHYLDEAELLSDRVVVLHKGKVLCCGSPLILRQSYGNGYKITFSFPERKEQYEVSDGNLEILMNLVNKIASNAVLSEIRKSEIDVIVPFNSSDGVSNNFEQVASTLEENQSILGFQSFAMNCTTLEQVFLDLCSKADEKENTNSKTETISQIGKSYNSVFTNSVEDIAPSKDDQILIDTGEKLTGRNIYKFFALLKKRLYHCMYDWRVLICALVLPTLFTAVAMGFSLIRPPHSNEPELKLTPHLYHPHTTSFISVDTKDMESFVNKVSREIVGLSPEKNLEMYLKSSRDCVCEGGMQKCSKSSYSSYDSLLKMSSANETIDWLVETQDEYIERRYGGWSMSDQYPNKSAMVVWYNNKGYHSMPSYLNTMNSAILRTISPGSSITTYSHPLKLSVDQLSKSSIAQHIADVGIAMVLLIAFSLVPASGSIYLVQERVNEEKRLQFLCGVSPTLYWIVAFVWDIIVLLIALVFAVLVFKIFGLPVYVARDNMAAVSLLIFLYGWACIPFVHLAQRLFNDASMANMILFCVCTFIGISELTCLLLMDILGKTQFVADLRIVLHKIYLIFPQFVLGDGLVEISKNNIQSEILQRFHMDTYVSPLSWELMGAHYLSLAIVGLILFMINLMIENDWFKSLKKKSTVYPSDASCLEIVNLCKVYNTVSGKHVAVNDITLKVPFGECLGLIGVNGAGKSTTFKMLTTELRPTSGRIFLQGREICRKPLYTGEMGYCPQCDCLDPKLTVRETLKLYLTLRGIDNKNEILNQMMTKFELSSYANRKNENLSGGNKRKLCTALSVLGKTSLILMDEPTSGMDPYSRNLVGETIQQLIKRNRSVILTSHSVEDCEALCSNIAVMINGKIVCQGSPQDLKERFGSGYIIAVRLAKQTEQDLLLDLMKKNFPGAEQISRQYCSSQFSVPTDKTKLSEMFGIMTKISEYVSVEDYNLVQSSLDQVFINLADKSDASNGVIDQKLLPNMYSMDII